MISIKKQIIKILSKKISKDNLDCSTMKKILIETLGAQIGDCIILSPFLESLSKVNDKIKIDIIVRENSIEILKYYPYIENIYPYKKYKNRILRYIYEFFFALKNRKKYDILISFEKRMSTLHILSLKILKPKYLMSACEEIKINIKEKLGMVDYYFKDKEEILKKLNFRNTGGGGYILYLGPYENFAENFFNKTKKNIIFNYIGSKKERILKEKEIINIISMLSNNFKKEQFYVSSIPKKFDETKKIVEELKKDNVKVLPKTKNIFEIASFIKYASVVISVDTSIIHIASTYNKPIIGFYTSNKQNQKSAGPKGKNCYIIECESSEKIENLNLDEIKEKMELILRI